MAAEDASLYSGNRSDVKLTTVSRTMITAVERMATVTTTEICRSCAPSLSFRLGLRRSDQTSAPMTRRKTLVQTKTKKRMIWRRSAAAGPLGSSADCTPVHPAIKPAKKRHDTIGTCFIVDDPVAAC